MEQPVLAASGAPGALVDVWEAEREHAAALRFVGRQDELELECLRTLPFRHPEPGEIAAEAGEQLFVGGTHAGDVAEDRDHIVRHRLGSGRLGAPIGSPPPSGIECLLVTAPALGMREHLICFA